MLTRRQRARIVVRRRDRRAISPASTSPNGDVATSNDAMQEMEREAVRLLASLRRTTAESSEPEGEAARLLATLRRTAEAPPESEVPRSAPPVAEPTTWQWETDSAIPDVPPLIVLGADGVREKLRGRGEV